LNKQEIEATDGIIKRLLADETQGVKNKKIFRIIKFFEKRVFKKAKGMVYCFFGWKK